jgi:hypothetical protein
VNGALSDLAEEAGVDGDVFDGARGGLHAQLILLEEVAEPVSVDQVDGRRTRLVMC